MTQTMYCFLLLLVFLNIQIHDEFVNHNKTPTTLSCRNKENIYAILVNNFNSCAEVVYMECK